MKIFQIILLIICGMLSSHVLINAMEEDHKDSHSTDQLCGVVADLHLPQERKFHLSFNPFIDPTVRRSVESVVEQKTELAPFWATSDDRVQTVCQETCLKLFDRVGEIYAEVLPEFERVFSYRALCTSCCLSPRRLRCLLVDVVRLMRMVDLVKKEMSAKKETFDCSDALSFLEHIEIELLAAMNLCLLVKFLCFFKEIPYDLNDLFCSGLVRDDDFFKDVARHVLFLKYLLEDEDCEDAVARGFRFLKLTKENYTQYGVHLAEEGFVEIPIKQRQKYWRDKLLDRLHTIGSFLAFMGGPLVDDPFTCGALIDLFKQADEKLTEIVTGFYSVYGERVEKFIREPSLLVEPKPPRIDASKKKKSDEELKIGKDEDFGAYGDIEQFVSVLHAKKIASYDLC